MVQMYELKKMLADAGLENLKNSDTLLVMLNTYLEDKVEEAFNTCLKRMVDEEFDEEEPPKKFFWIHVYDYRKFLIKGKDEKDAENRYTGAGKIYEDFYGSCVNITVDEISEKEAREFLKEIDEL